MKNEFIDNWKLEWRGEDCASNSLKRLSSLKFTNTSFVKDYELCIEVYHILQKTLDHNRDYYRIKKGE